MSSIDFVPKRYPIHLFCMLLSKNEYLANKVYEYCMSFLVFSDLKGDEIRGFKTTFRLLGKVKVSEIFNAASFSMLGFMASYFLP